MPTTSLAVDLLGIAIPATFLVMLALERFGDGVRWPAVPRWRLIGTLFFVVTVALNAATPFLLPSGWLARHRLMDGGRLGTFGGAVAGYLVFSLAGYWWHRLQHRSDFIWRWVHQLHHSANRMEMLGALLFHPFEMLAIAAINLVVCLFVLGLPPLPTAIVGFVAAFFAFFQHWNVRTPRWLGYLIERPEAHSLHHEKDVQARNYSDLPLWDLAFGTFENPARFEGQVGFEPAAARRIPAMLLGVDVNGDGPRFAAPARSTSVAAAAAVVLGALLLTGAVARAERPEVEDCLARGAAVPQLVWTPCGPGVECAVAVVPAGDEYARGCRAQDDLSRHLSTANAARDLELLRKAVGDARLNYLGISYGTQLGSTCASLFPGHIRAAVLDSAFDGELYSSDRFRFARETALAQEAQLQRFFRFCAADKVACPFPGATAQQVETGFQDLLRRADLNPLAGGPGDPRAVRGSTVRFGTIAALYDPRNFPLLGIALALGGGGDGSILQLLADAFAGRRPGGTFSNFIDALTGIVAADSAAPKGRRATIDHVTAAIAEAPTMGPLYAVLDARRRLLPDDDDAFTGRYRNPRGAETLLVVGSTEDNATPFHWAQSLVAQLGNARLLTRQGSGHGALFLSACIRNAEFAYLLDGTLPAPGTTCND